MLQKKKNHRYVKYNEKVIQVYGVKNKTKLRNLNIIIMKVGDERLGAIIHKGLDKCFYIFTNNSFEDG